MSYLALYRKYRPTNFDEVVGQKAVVTALRNQVKYHQLGHAYLFCGTRGTGKTSTAKVFARAVNCQDPVDGNPCNQCELCRESESNFNVIEIDAASNNSVDNIRDLRDEVQYAPSVGKYKVYIIDEVHMLSSSAFNALLKTLEEPPEHVIFVLATTDPQKVLPTIVSRCQRYDFKRITTEEIFEHLKDVCRKEGIQAEEEALRYIAGIADGGMRDALSVLDQCHSYYINDLLSLSRVQEVLGAVDDTIFYEMTDALRTSDTARALRGIKKIFDDGRDGLQFVTSWNVYLRNLLVAMVLGAQSENLLEIEVGQMEKLKDLASRCDRSKVSFWIESLAKLEADLKTVSQRRILMEVSVIRLIGEAGRTQGVSTQQVSMVPQGAQAQVLDGEIKRMERRVERLEKNLREGNFNVRPQAETPEAKSEEPAPKMSKEVSGIPEAKADIDTQEVLEKWPSIKTNFVNYGPMNMVIHKITVHPGYEKGTLVLRSESSIFLDQISIPSKLKQLENAIADETGKRFRIIVDKKGDRKPGLSQDILNSIHMDVEVR